MAIGTTGLGLAKPVKPKKKTRDYSQKYIPHIGFSQFHQDRYSQHMARDGYMGAYYNPQQRKPQAPAERKWTRE